MLALAGFVGKVGLIRDLKYSHHRGVCFHYNDSYCLQRRPESTCMRIRTPWDTSMYPMGAQCNWKWDIEPIVRNSVAHFKSFVFLWFRVKDKLAWLSVCERKTCEECLREFLLLQNRKPQIQWVLERALQFILADRHLIKTKSPALSCS